MAFFMIEFIFKLGATGWVWRRGRHTSLILTSKYDVPTIEHSTDYKKSIKAISNS